MQRFISIIAVSMLALTEGAANLRDDIYCDTFFFADYRTAKYFKIIKD